MAIEYKDVVSIETEENRTIEHRVRTIEIDPTITNGATNLELYQKVAQLGDLLPLLKGSNPDAPFQIKNGKLVVQMKDVVKRREFHFLFYQGKDKMWKMDKGKFDSFTETIRAYKDIDATTNRKSIHIGGKMTVAEAKDKLAELNAERAKDLIEGVEK